MGQALPKPSLRPFLAEDTPVLAAIFAAAIEELTGDDYGEAQQQAWAGAAADEEQFGKRLASELTLIATLQNSPVGFAALKGKDHIDMLYVHPGAAGQGVASMLLEALSPQFAAAQQVAKDDARISAKYASCIDAVNGPGLPVPIGRSSSSRTGVTSAAVPVKNASSAM